MYVKMSNSVMIKGNKSGIILVLDAELDFNILKQEIAKKFKDSSKFLGSAQMALTFEGRELNTIEQKEILDIIEDNSDLKIICIVDTNEKTEALFQKSLNEKLLDLNSNSGQFYKGNLRSGQVLEMETSVVIIGDVNNGAKVMSKGNIIVLGALKGTACAGISGNAKSFIVALYMHPIQVRISDYIAIAPDLKQNDKKHRKLLNFKKTKQKEDKFSIQEPEIAFVENGNICIQPFNKDVLYDINL